MNTPSISKHVGVISTGASSNVKARKLEIFEERTCENESGHSRVGEDVTFSEINSNRLSRDMLIDVVHDQMTSSIKAVFEKFSAPIPPRNWMNSKINSLVTYFKKGWKFPELSWRKVKPEIQNFLGLLQALKRSIGVDIENFENYYIHMYIKNQLASLSEVQRQALLNNFLLEDFKPEIETRVETSAEVANLYYRFMSDLKTQIIHSPFPWMEDIRSIDVSALTGRELTNLLDDLIRARRIFASARSKAGLVMQKEIEILGMHACIEQLGRSIDATVEHLRVDRRTEPMALPASDEIINWGIAHTGALEWTKHPRMEPIRMRLRNFALTLASFRTPEIASIFRSIPEQGFYNLYNVLDIHEHQQARRALREGWHEMGVIQQAQYRPYQSSSITSSIGIGRFHRISGRFH